MNGAQLIDAASTVAGSRSELAERIGVHTATIERWAAGSHPMRHAFSRVLRALVDGRPLQSLHLSPTVAQHLATQLDCWPMTIYRCARENDLFCGWAVVELEYSDDLADAVYGSDPRPPRLRSFFEARYVGPQ